MVFYDSCDTFRYGSAYLYNPYSFRTSINIKWKDIPFVKNYDTFEELKNILGRKNQNQVIYFSKISSTNAWDISVCLA